MEVKNGRKPGPPSVKPVERTNRRSPATVSESRRPSAPSSGAGASRVALSSGQAEVGRILELLADVPEVDLDRVHQLREEIANGRYNPDPEVTAERIIEEALMLGAVDER